MPPIDPNLAETIRLGSSILVGLVALAAMIHLLRHTRRTEAKLAEVARLLQPKALDVTSDVAATLLDLAERKAFFHPEATTPVTPVVIRPE